MTDHRAASIRAHQRNLDRYRRLLVTDLTDLEREFVHKRIAEERFKLERLEAQANTETASAFIAAQALAKRGRSHI